MKISIFTLLVFIASSSSLALRFELQDAKNNVVGEPSEVTIEESQTLEQVGRDHELGPREMQAANPTLSKTAKLPAGTSVVLPTQFILPKEREGIVINVAEFRLYFFPEGSNSVETFPVAIAAVGRPIPQGTTKVVQKLIDPVWYPTPSERAVQPSLPRAVGPGPKNPLGPRALLLGIPDVLIHGTNKPSSVGTRASFGCFRMFKEHVGSFWDRVPVGMKVSLVNRPTNLGIDDDDVYIRMMPALEGDSATAQFDQAIADLRASTDASIDFSVDLQSLKNGKRDGSVVKVGRLDRSPEEESAEAEEPASESQTSRGSQAGRAFLIE